MNIIFANLPLFKFRDGKNVHADKPTGCKSKLGKDPFWSSSADTWKNIDYKRVHFLDLHNNYRLEANGL